MTQISALDNNPPGKIALHCESGVADGLLLRRDTGVVDFSRTIPTRLPEALRNASERAFGHATDPLNQLDYNPYIGDEWAIVAAEFQSLAGLLERRFCALFEGNDARRGSPHPQPNHRSRLPEAMARTTKLLFDGAIQRLPACSRGFLPAGEHAERRMAEA